MVIADFVRRADDLIDLGHRTLSTRQLTVRAVVVADALFAEFRAAGLSFLNGMFGPGHPYTQEFGARVAMSTADHVSAGVGILQGARGEVAGGWAVAVKTLVAAEIFTDFLEMSGYFLNSGYKDPAAVMTGSVLEERLRQLCRKHNIPTDAPDAKGKAIVKRADTLNAELAAAGVYNKLDQKNVTAWLDLRNKAAHGKYSEYTSDQATNMHHGVSEFMARIVA